MVDAIDVAPGVLVPSAALEARSVRASGPGGQNVNKVASKVELLVELSGIEGLDEPAAARLLRLAGRKRAVDGRLRVTAQESRDRHRNLETAREKVRALVAAALVVPKARKPTRPRAAARERRLSDKKRTGVVKAKRKPVFGEE
jgi:ribosome-associated protein